jgi:adenylate kinase
MRLLLIGPPGSGKGTQAKQIARHYGLAHISSGDLLRQHVADGTAVGQTVAAYLDRGDLVPDGIVLDILRKPVEAATLEGGYVLDGFPRTVEQAKAAYLVARDLGAEVQVALYLQVPRAELMRRLLGRGRQAGRTDDTQAVVEHRLRVFEEATPPLVGYYAERETLLTVDGGQPPDEVTRAVLDQLDPIAERLR